MIRRSFNADWSAGPGLTAFASITGASSADRPTVTLPYDVIRDLPRSPDSVDGAHTGYFPGGFFEYAKTFDVPEEYRQKTRHVRVRGRLPRRRRLHQRRLRGAAPERLHRTSTSRPTRSCATARRTRSGSKPARTGHAAGTPARASIATRSSSSPTRSTSRSTACAITTPDVDAERAVVAIATTVENETRATRTVRVATRILDADGALVAAGSAPLTLLPGATRGRARAALRALARAVERGCAEPLHRRARRSPTASRTLDEETDHVRHPHAAARPAARTAHQRRDGEPARRLHPPRQRAARSRRHRARRGAPHRDPQGRRLQRHPQRAQPDQQGRPRRVRPRSACSSWTRRSTCGRRPSRRSTTRWRFPEWWERDVEAMVAKDFNHPSVVMYSIGNEIFETGRPIGSAWGRKLAEKVRVARRHALRHQRHQPPARPSPTGSAS